VVGEAADGHEAVERCAKLRPDVVLMDVNMPGLGGLEATLEIRRTQPDVKILVLTQYEDREYIRRFLQAGVSGYILKKSAGTELAASIRARPRVAGARPGSGQGGLPEPAARRRLRRRVALRRADRSREAGAQARAEGRSNKEVADLLDISVKTAMSHREHIMEKLGLHSRTELIKFAIREGVIRVERA